MKNKNTNIDHNIANALGINLSLPENIIDDDIIEEETALDIIEEDENTELLLQTAIEQLRTAENIEKLDKEYDSAIKRKERLMVLAEKLFLDASEMALTLESSRGVEVSALLLKMIFDENANLELHQKHAWIRSELDGSNDVEQENGAIGHATQNNIENAIFVGSTADLQAQIKEMQKAKDEDEND